MERDFKGVWIPREIWLNSDLKIMEKMFLTEIISLDGEHGCYASNSYFSDFFGLSRCRCSIIIKSLKDKGYLKIRRFYEKYNNYIERRIISVNKNSIENNQNRRIKKTHSSTQPIESAGDIEIVDAVEVVDKVEVINESEVTNESEVRDETKVTEVIDETGVTNETEVIDEIEVTEGTEVTEVTYEAVVRDDDVISRSVEIPGEKTGNPMYVDVINYLNEKCKTRYRPTTTKNQRLINARLKEGYDLDDFKSVINKKYKSWAGTTMDKYLRPETLFGTKFEGYINEVRMKSNRGGQANGGEFRNDENNRENQVSGETEEASRWSQGENRSHRSLTEEEREWAKRELF